MIITRTPFRISFFGGGTDFPEWFNFHGGSVLSTSIDKYCYILCRKLPPFFDYKYRVVWSQIELVNKVSEIRHPSVRETLRFLNDKNSYELIHNADLPARSGLGSSSSFTVGLLNNLYAMQGKLVNGLKLASDAIHIERNLINEVVGYQDQISASLGGFNKIDFFQNDNFKVQPIILDKKRSENLQNNLMLFFTGFSRFSSEIAEKQLANINNNYNNLKLLSEFVDEGIKILQGRSSLNEFGKLLHESWLLKRNLSSSVSNKDIDNIYELAINSGAIGGKILGAGGGGFILFYVPKKFQSNVRSSLKNLTYVPFNFENSGSRVVLYQPDGLE
jgi:D-glycero-alpha-D-manno-heptose-7-phosphate kinase